MFPITTFINKIVSKIVINNVLSLLFYFSFKVNVCVTWSKTIPVWIIFCLQHADLSSKIVKQMQLVNLPCDMATETRHNTRNKCLTLLLVDPQLTTPEKILTTYSCCRDFLHQRRRAIHHPQYSNTDLFVLCPLTRLVEKVPVNVRSKTCKIILK
jgi:hypothetical protein